MSEKKKFKPGDRKVFSVEGNNDTCYFWKSSTPTTRCWHLAGDSYVYAPKVLPNRPFSRYDILVVEFVELLPTTGYQLWRLVDEQAEET